MSQIRRQDNLFAAEDWRIIYQTFNQVNFTTYDFDSIRRSLIDYTRENFSEEFNNYINNDEYIAIINVLSYLAQSLAFRVDLNTRENFLDTAQRRSSILRLARLLSYAPRRNVAARGNLKVQAIRTTESIQDFNGVEIGSNSTILWNDSNNSEWFDQFIEIINSAFQPSNPFGQPIAVQDIAGVQTQLYRINQSQPLPSPRISVPTRGQNLEFNIVPIKLTQGIQEQTPETSTFTLMYMRDGLGNDSAQTGFFVHCVQGSLNINDFNIQSPQPNLLLDVPNTGVNNRDVWVQSVNSSGVISEWTEIPNINGENLIFNGVNDTQGRVFSVITGDNDTISIQFGDGSYGDIPTGTVRVITRSSVGSSASIDRTSIQQQLVRIPYKDTRGRDQTLTLLVGLTQDLNNSQPSETDLEIKQRAPLVYYTQNRMVTGQDYNLFPRTQDNLLRVQAVNRTYSGHNRLVDVVDPTGSHQSVRVLADDGIIYQESNINLRQVSQNQALTEQTIVTDVLLPILNSIEFSQDLLDQMYRMLTGDVNYTGGIDWSYFTPQELIWSSSSQSTTANTGVIIQSGQLVSVGVNIPAANSQDLIRPGSTILFDQQGWRTVQSVSGSGDFFDATGAGGIALNHPVGTGASIVQILPPVRTGLTQEEFQSIVSALEQDQTFAIYWDLLTGVWRVLNEDVTSGGFVVDNVRQYQSFDTGQAWNILVRRENTGQQMWTVRSRSLSTVFESKNQVRFFHDTNSAPDVIKFLGINQGINQPDEYLTVVNDYRYSDGYQEPRRVVVSGYDQDKNSVQDDPTLFTRLVPNPEYLFWEQYTSWDGKIYRRPVDITRQYKNATEADQDYQLGVINSGGQKGNPDWRAGDLIYWSTPESHWIVWDDSRYDESGVTVGGLSYQAGDVVYPSDRAASTGYTTAQGRRGIYFQWQHEASFQQRIDPTASNIIDMFALTKDYDTRFRQWIASGAIGSPPEPSNQVQLTQAYQDLNQAKMLSDELIWRPVRYRAILGPGSDPDLRATIKVVKTPISTASDAEIKSRVVQLINQFFEIDNWNFGDTFFATELITYIHTKMAGEISSVVIVPDSNSGRFGDLFEIPAASDEILISSAGTAQVIVANSLNSKVLRS